MPSACSRWPPVGSGLERSKTPMLSRPRKPPAKRLRPSGSLRLTHQVKLSSSFWKHALEEDAIAPAPGPGHLVDAPAGPGVDRRVHVVEGELVGGDLAVGVHVPLAQQQHELLLGELGIDVRERDHVEGEVPGGVPGILPLVRHRDHVPVVQVRPVGLRPNIRPRAAAGLRGVALEPVPDHEVVELLAPEQAGVALAQHAALVVGRASGNPLGVELVGLLDAVAGTPRRSRSRRACPGSACRSGGGAAPPAPLRRGCRAIPERRLASPRPMGSPPPCSPWTTARWNASFT